jgi:hypothetical protein
MPATLNGVPFRSDPHVIAWDFKPKVASKKTVGGKVVQVFGVELGDLTMEGSFGRGGWEEQSDFLDRMKTLGDNQMESQVGGVSVYPQPYRFFWPEKDWDMLVWLKAFSDGTFASVTLKNEEINPKWQLTLHIVEDNSGLKKVAMDAFIERLAVGIGWRQSEFNGPIDWTEASALWQKVGATDVRSFLNIAFGRGTQTPTGNQDAAGTPGAATSYGDPAPANINEVQAYVKAEAAKRGWTGAEWDALYDLVNRESTWRVDAANPDSSARGLFQKMTSIHGPIESTYQGQTAWGLDYIAGRYGTPSAAIAYHNIHHSY